MRHSEVRNLLYDYLSNELTNEERVTVESHLSSCKPCSEELRGLQQTLAILPHPSDDPSGERDETVWRRIAENVEREFQERHRPSPHLLDRLVETLRSYCTLRPASAYAIGGSLAVVILALALMRWQPKQHVTDGTTQPVDSTAILARYETQERISEYFRKSRTLLVGIANMKTDDEQNLDLSAERKLSRSLVHEARYLRHQPLDGRSARLVDDLQKILIELANLEERNDAPNVEIIRSGIHQENLLFKIRMAEASYDTSRAGYIRTIY